MMKFISTWGFKPGQTPNASVQIQLPALRCTWERRDEIVQSQRRRSRKTPRPAGQPPLVGRGRPDSGVHAALISTRIFLFFLSIPNEPGLAQLRLDWSGPRVFFCAGWRARTTAPRRPLGRGLVCLARTRAHTAGRSTPLTPDTKGSRKKASELGTIWLPAWRKFRGMLNVMFHLDW